MRLLLDTQAFLWLCARPDRLSPSTREIFIDPGNELLLSAASGWEIAIKWAIGKLELPASPAEYVPARMRRHAVLGLPIEHRHALGVAALPPHHSDPFDRLLIAQALDLGVPLVTSDRRFASYGIEALQA